jgi:hypothetical protein
MAAANQFISGSIKFLSPREEMLSPFVNNNPEPYEIKSKSLRVNCCWI